MEDAHSAIIGIPDIGENVSWFAVFDGHGGASSSDVCSANLFENICSSDGFMDALRMEHSLGEEELLDKVKSGILSGFLKQDENLRKIPDFDKSGTTAVCALISEKYVLFSNCGDSRCLVSQNSKPVMATKDHKPANPQEEERIQKAGGNVKDGRFVFPSLPGSLGVSRGLNVSRGLGDFKYKNTPEKGPTEQLVSAQPEFYYKVREPEKDEFVVLACDGVWNVMSNEDICSFIAARMRVTPNLVEITNDVAKVCLRKVTCFETCFEYSKHPNSGSLKTRFI